MSATWLLVRRNFGGNRVRLVTSVGGVALALSLTLALEAIYAGVANQLTTYIDESGADVWVSQAGVRNLHMVASWLPARVGDDVRAVDGVADATPILYSTDTIAAGDERTVAYVIGLPANASVGGPWNVVDGADQPGRREVIVDATFAESAGVAMGDRISVLGAQARVVGLSDGTASLLNSVAFVSFDDFRALRGGAPVISYLLVRTAPGVDPDLVAARIEREVEGVTAQSAARFSGEERRLVMDMSAEVVSIMNIVGFVVGLSVVALTVYVAIQARRREYGALKALGANNAYLYRTVLGQAFLTVAIGFVTGIIFTELVDVAVARTSLGLELALEAESVGKVAVIAALIAAVAALLPIRQIAGLDPAMVFRRGAVL